jgi:hypothetical protein
MRVEAARVSIQVCVVGGSVIVDTTLTWLHFLNIEVIEIQGDTYLSFKAELESRN